VEKGDNVRNIVKRVEGKTGKRGSRLDKKKNPGGRKVWDSEGRDTSKSFPKNLFSGGGGPSAGGA